MKLAAIGDIHIKETDKGAYHDVFVEISEKADVLLLCGDLTDQGTSQEAKILADNLRVCTIPVIAILGNHDYEKGDELLIKSILSNGRVIVLDGDAITIKGVGFVGLKGFCGGFDQHLLTSWGERSIKVFVEETMNDVLRLENALKRLETEKKVVLMHYSPLKQTVMGEPPEIFPFLGSSRYMGPLERFDVDVVFHGHAHHGTVAGKSPGGVPVFNVSYPLLQKQEKPLSYMLYTI